MKHTRRFVVAGVTASLAIGASGALAAVGGEPIEMQVDETTAGELRETVPTVDSPSASVEDPTVDTVSELSEESPLTEASVDDDEAVAGTEVGTLDATSAPSPASEPSEVSAVSQPSTASAESAASVSAASVSAASVEEDEEVGVEDASAPSTPSVPSVEDADDDAES